MQADAVKQIKYIIAASLVAAAPAAPAEAAVTVRSATAAAAAAAVAAAATAAAVVLVFASTALAAAVEHLLLHWQVCFRQESPLSPQETAACAWTGLSTCAANTRCA